MFTSPPARKNEFAGNDFPSACARPASDPYRAVPMPSTIVSISQRAGGGMSLSTASLAAAPTVTVSEPGPGVSTFVSCPMSL